jgi:hypothetical protein
MSPDSEDVQFKVNSLEEGLNGRHKDTEGQGIIGWGKRTMGHSAEMREGEIVW